MSPKFESPNFASLLAEQEAVQAMKFQGRQLSEYNSYMFPGQHWLRPRSDDVTDFLKHDTFEETVSLDGMLRALCRTNAGNPVRWADMGGGRALAMRQIATDPENYKQLEMINVDLFDYGLEGVTPEEIEYLERLAPGMTEASTAPTFINADAEVVTLPEKVDLITSVETIQYLNNPLAAIANWYNQLKDEHVMIITAEHAWSEWIRYQSDLHVGHASKTPTAHLFDVFDLADIRFAASLEPDTASKYRAQVDPAHFKTLVVQKKHGTRLAVNSQLVHVWTSPYNSKAAYYEAPEPSGLPIIEVITEIAE